MSPRFLIVFCSVLIVCRLAMSARLHAVDYTIDSSQSATSTNFHSLEDLRDYLVTNTLSLNNNDTISLYQNDSSLMENFDIMLGDGESITIKSGDGTAYTITQDSSSQPGTDNGGVFNFGHATGDTVTLNLDGVNLADNQANVTGNNTGYGGAVYSVGNLVVNYQSGVKFSGNSAASEAGNYSDYGGAVYSAGSLTIGMAGGDGTLEFSGNSALGGGAYSGQGGAVFSGGHLTFEDGTFIFSDNQARNAGQGGAVYANGGLTFMQGKYTFTDNSADGTLGSYRGYGGAICVYGGITTFSDGEYLFSGNQAKAYGGAIYADSDLIFTNGKYTFSGNHLLPGYTASNVSGGAVYGDLNITFHDGDYTFTDNYIVGSEAHGGAIGSEGNIIFADGTYRFSNNYIDSSGATATQDSTALGGAIYGIGIVKLQAGNYLFSNNSVIGGEGYNSALGGAITTLNQGIELGGGEYTFTGNFAIGGMGTVSGLGGAIYTSLMSSSGSITNAVFLNNTATTKNVNDPTSGRGGAVFVDNESSLSQRSFLLKATDGHEVLFQGNMQGHENALTANGIYFGATDVGASRFSTTNATFNAEGTGQILMYDPMASQGGQYFEDNNNYNLLLNLTKTGTGLWLLGGTSNLDSRANVTIDEGTLRLYGDAHIKLNNTNRADFAFNAASTFSPTIYNNVPVGFDNGVSIYHDSVSSITTGTINVDTAATLKPVGISSLAAGDHRFVDAIVATSGSIVPGTFEYVPTGNMFEKAWYDPNATDYNHDLVILGVKNIGDDFCVDPFIDIYRQEDLSDEERAVFDEVYETGSLDPLNSIPDLKKYLACLKGSEILDLLNMRRTDAMIMRNLLFDRMGCDWRRDLSHKHSLWGIISQDWAKLGDFTYKPFVFTFGSDRHAGRWTLGVAGQYSNGNIKTAGKINMRNKTDGLTLGLYANRCGRKYHARGLMQFGVGWNDVSTLYTSSGVRTGGSFENVMLGTSVEFGRTFRFGEAEDPWTLTPHVGFDYYYLHASALEEYGPSTTRGFRSTGYNVAELPVGLRLAKTFMTPDGRTDWIRPTLDVTYAHSVGDRAPKATAIYLDNPGSAWTAVGTKIGRDALRLNVGVEGRFWNRFETGLSYQHETRKHYASHQLNASATWRW